MLSARCVFSLAPTTPMNISPEPADQPEVVALIAELDAYQTEALGLYAALSQERRGPFGDYANDPLSIFMQKRLADGGTTNV
jgi:hypothetical protein